MEMKPLRMTDALRVGEDTIDAQHGCLMELINGIVGRDAKSEAKMTHCRAFDALLGEHCAYEEALMKDTGYPRHDAHVRHHAVLLRECDEAVGLCEEQESCDDCNVQRLLALVVEDMLKSDSDFKNFLDYKGVTQVF